MTLIERFSQIPNDCRQVMIEFLYQNVHFSFDSITIVAIAPEFNNMPFVNSDSQIYVFQSKGLRFYQTTYAMNEDERINDWLIPLLPLNEVAKISPTIVDPYALKPYNSDKVTELVVIPLYGEKHDYVHGYAIIAHANSQMIEWGNEKNYARLSQKLLSTLEKSWQDYGTYLNSKMQAQQWFVVYDDVILFSTYAEALPGQSFKQLEVTLGTSNLTYQVQMVDDFSYVTIVPKTVLKTSIYAKEALRDLNLNEYSTIVYLRYHGDDDLAFTDHFATIQTKLQAVLPNYEYKSYKVSEEALVLALKECLAKRFSRALAGHFDQYDVLMLRVGYDIKPRMDAFAIISYLLQSGCSDFVMADYLAYRQAKESLNVALKDTVPNQMHLQYYYNQRGLTACLYCFDQINPTWPLATIAHYQDQIYENLLAKLVEEWPLMLIQLDYRLLELRHTWNALRKIRNATTTKIGIIINDFEIDMAKSKEYIERLHRNGLFVIIDYGRFTEMLSIFTQIDGLFIKTQDYLNLQQYDASLLQLTLERHLFHSKLVIVEAPCQDLPYIHDLFLIQKKNSEENLNEKN